MSNPTRAESRRRQQAELVEIVKEFWPNLKRDGMAIASENVYDMADEIRKLRLGEPTPVQYPSRAYLLRRIDKSVESSLRVDSQTDSPSAHIRFALRDILTLLKRDATEEL